MSKSGLMMEDIRNSGCTGPFLFCEVCQQRIVDAENAFYYYGKHDEVKGRSTSFHPVFAHKSCVCTKDGEATLVHPMDSEYLCSGCLSTLLFHLIHNLGLDPTHPSGLKKLKAASVAWV